MKDIPDTDNLARVCGRRKQIRDPETGKFVGILYDFFALKEKNGTVEGYLSCDWYDYFKQDKTKNVLKALMNRPCLYGKTAVLPILNVSNIKACGKKRGVTIKIHNRTKKTDPSYSSIHGLPSDNSNIDLLQELVDEAIVKIEPT